MKILKSLLQISLISFVGILISCENNSDSYEIIEPAIQEPIDLSKDSLYISKNNPSTFELVDFKVTVNTNGKEIRDVYDSLTFAVSNIDKELKFFSISYEDPNNPIGHPQEFGPNVWKHYFTTPGLHTAYIYTYKNGVKKLLKSADFNVSKSSDLFNVNWNNFKAEQLTFVNLLERHRINVSKSLKSISFNNNIKVIGATCNWQTTHWPFKAELYNRSNEIFLDYLESTYGSPTYLTTIESNIINIFNSTFVSTKLSSPESIYGIWITETSNIAVIIQKYSESQQEYQIIAEEKK